MKTIRLLYQKLNGIIGSDCCFKIDSVFMLWEVGM